MSPVMEVVIDMASSPSMRAVLKLYDRRFGSHLRKVMGKHIPHTTTAEEGFQRFVNDGYISPFLARYNQERKVARIAMTAEDVHEDSPDGSARYEAALWQECVDYFDSETTAYERLANLQGKSIPRMHAHVRLTPLSGLPSSSDMVPYFEIKGVILDLISGYSLWDLSLSPAAPPDPAKWSGIIQTAVDAAHEINKRGIILNDCGPRNVVVDQRTQTPFILDLAQCDFKKIIERVVEYLAEQSSASDDEAWDPDVEYWEQVRQAHNTGAIGSVMVTRVLRTKNLNLKMHVKYPRYDEIVDDLKCRKNGL